MAQVLEDLDEVKCYVKNQGLNFTIPYMLNGEQKQYFPDFIVRCHSGLNLIVEVSGEARKDKARPHRRSGCPPSTTMADSASGRSLR